MFLPTTPGTGPHDDPLHREGDWVGQCRHLLKVTEHVTRHLGSEPGCMTPEPPPYQPGLLKRLNFAIISERRGQCGQVLTLYCCLLWVLNFCFHGLLLRGNSPSSQHISGGSRQILVSKPVVACVGPGTQRRTKPQGPAVQQKGKRRGTGAGFLRVIHVLLCGADVRPGSGVGASAHHPHALEQHLCGFATFNTTSAIYLTLPSNSLTCKNKSLHCVHLERKPHLATLHRKTTVTR